MKKLLILTVVVFLSACASLSGSQSYIPIGPQDLSVQVKKPESMPIYVTRSEIKRPWASIGLLRIKNLPNDRAVINRELNRIKRIAAQKGAQALVVNQYFEDNADTGYPITLAAYLVKFLDNVNDEDKAKIDDFAKMAAMENAKS